ncbi:unnamed protein product [Adineta steineri]|uniref:G-protein coupled receptors family 1 profile domain-containing protein n=1 Tax=Adineta steineri TaxID=433720 RepID=A0A818HLA3_9BILA|nr:unnamed protein product [Adineta steineri]
MYQNIPVTNNDTIWCRSKVYFATVAMVCALYANTFQALHRFCRIIYYTRLFFHRNIYLYSFGILIQIFLSILQPLSVLVTGVYQYEDYHCQMSLTNWRGTILGAFLIWLSPITIIVIIYACTLSYIRHYSITFTVLQHTRIKRDFTVIKRIIIYCKEKINVYINMEREGAPEPGFFNAIRREEGKIEGEFRDIERSHEQREADKYENRADKYERKEEEDFNQGRFP